MRLIDADALIQKRSYAKAYSPEMYVIGQGYVMDAPTIDAVPVVRCRECKNHGTLKSGELFCGKIKTGIYGYYHTVKADDYCSHGERKEDGK